MLNFTTSVKQMGEADKPAKNTNAEAVVAPSTSDPGATIDSFGAAALADAQRANLEVIGPYRLVRKLGQGGMGQVWLAEQTEPIHRQVALKLIKVGRYDDSVLQRFYAERQSLAIMDHPSIAKVFDAGATPDGQPYFVMEYVPGQLITNYCDRQRLKIRERLELFIKVCEGVQHAHQKAVMHRDLKPANILVVEVDGKPVPRIIDFGLAKPSSPQLDGETLLTQAGGWVGTPGYMSPEQADAGRVDVDTRTDVYSLGAVLYELLTGFLPFETSGWQKQRLDVFLRQLQEEDPPRPSTKVSAQKESSKTASAARGTEPKQLASLLHGDLDWITLKALEKDRTRRYGTPMELAADIRRYLAHEPITARPDSIAYRTSKFLRRHWAPATAAALVIAALIAGLYEINRERVISQRRFSDVRQLAGKLLDLDVQVRELAGSTAARQTLVNTALEYLRRLSTDVRGDPDLALEVGNAYMRVARVQGVPISPSLGQGDQAEQNLRIADQFIQSVLKAEPGNRTAMLRSAQITHDRMILARFRNDPEAALEFAKKSAGWLEKYQARKGDEAESSAILNTYLNVADQFNADDEFDEALRLCGRATEIAGMFNRTSQKGNFLRISAMIFRKRGELDQAFAAIQEAVKLLDPGSAWITQRGQTGNFQLALVYEGKILGEDDAPNLGRWEEATKPLQHAYQIADELARRDPNDHSSLGDLATAAIPLGGILRHSDPARALEIYDHTLHLLAETSGDLHLKRYEVPLLAGSSYPLRKLRRGDEARRRIEGALERLKQQKAYPAAEIDLGSSAEDAVRALADQEAETGNLTSAAKEYDDLLSRVVPTEKDAEFNVEDAVRLSNLCSSAAALHRRRGEPEKASALEARRLAIWRMWDSKSPNNPFIHRQLEAAPGNVPPASGS